MEQVFLNSVDEELHDANGKFTMYVSTVYNYVSTVFCTHVVPNQ